MNQLSTEDAAYIAGLIDGEGTITLTRLHVGEHRRLVLSISNNDRRLLEFVKSSVGGGKITGKRCYCENHYMADHQPASDRPPATAFGQAPDIQGAESRPGTSPLCATDPEER